MGRSRAPADEEQGGDFAIGVPLRQQSQDIDLSPAQSTHSFIWRLREARRQGLGNRLFEGEFATRQPLRRCRLWIGQRRKRRLARRDNRFAEPLVGAERLVRSLPRFRQTERALPIHGLQVEVEPDTRVVSFASAEQPRGDGPLPGCRQTARDASQGVEHCPEIVKPGRDVERFLVQAQRRDRIATGAGDISKPGDGMVRDEVARSASEAEVGLSIQRAVEMAFAISISPCETAMLPRWPRIELSAQVTHGAGGIDLTSLSASR